MTGICFDTGTPRCRRSTSPWAHPCAQGWPGACGGHATPNRAADLRGSLPTMPPCSGLGESRFHAISQRWWQAKVGGRQLSPPTAFRRTRTDGRTKQFVHCGPRIPRSESASTWLFWPFRSTLQGRVAMLYTVPSSEKYDLCVALHISVQDCCVEPFVGRYGSIDREMVCHPLAVVAAELSWRGRRYRQMSPRPGRNPPRRRWQELAWANGPSSSPTPSTAVVTTGFPLAIASSTTRGRPSQREVRTKQVAGSDDLGQIGPPADKVDPPVDSQSVGQPPKWPLIGAPSGDDQVVLW